MRHLSPAHVTLGVLLLCGCSAAADDHAATADGKPTTPSSSGGGGSGGATLAAGGSTSTGSGGSGACVLGKTQSCYPFAQGTPGQGTCAAGTQKCEGSGEFGKWGACEGATGPAAEVCDDGIDQDCDGSDATCASGGSAGAGGAAGAGGGGGGSAGGGGAGGTGGGATDEVCKNIQLLGDCLTVSCPASAPHPKSCSVFFSPGDDRGCVASTPQSPVVYFQAGDQCNVGLVTGTLCCSKTPQAPLDQNSCPINKPQQIHASSKSGCPAIKN